MFLKYKYSKSCLGLSCLMWIMIGNNSRPWKQTGMSFQADEGKGHREYHLYLNTTGSNTYWDWLQISKWHQEKIPWKWGIRTSLYNSGITQPYLHLAGHVGLGIIQPQLSNWVPGIRGKYPNTYSHFSNSLLVFHSLWFLCIMLEKCCPTTFRSSGAKKWWTAM